MYFINTDICLKVSLYILNTNQANWTMGRNSFWQFEFLTFMTALFLNFLKMWKILEVNIHKNYFGSHST
jgi:hypothetical protein